MNTMPHLPPTGRQGETLIPSPPLLISHLARSSQPDAAHVARTIAGDMTLSIRLLRFAAGRFPACFPSNVEEAAQQLGAAAAQLMVQAFCMIDAVHGNSGMPPDSARRLWARSLLTGMIAQRLVPGHDTPQATEHFVAGLLSDVGCIILEQAFPSHYAAAIQEAHGGRALDEAERRLLPVGHCDVSRLVFLVWQMPAHLVEAVAAHHAADCLARDHAAYRTAAAVEVAAELAAAAIAAPDWSPDDLRPAVASLERHAGHCGWALDRLAQPWATEFARLAALLNLPAAPEDVFPAERQLVAWVRDGMLGPIQ
jgi:HD-like signal output (HDOD) protein